MRRAARPAPLRADGAVSEVLGTVMLTAVTIVLVSGFGIIVFKTMTGTDEPSPTASFAIEAVSGLSYVNVSMREGTSFLLSEARYALGVNGTALPSGYLVAPMESGRFSTGDVMRFNLTSGVVGTGMDLAFFVADIDSNQMIGHASASVPASSSLPVFSSNALTIGTVAFSPSSITADGATSTTMTVQLTSSTGLGLVETVEADLGEVGGGTLTLRDDGTMGDAVANDGIFTGTFTASSSALGGAASVTADIPITATDVLGHSATASGATLDLVAAAGSGGLTEDDILAMIQNQTSATNIIGVGGVSRNLASSATVETLAITNWTWVSITHLKHDLLVFRVSDISDATKTWVLEVYLDDCASPNGGIISVIMKRDGVAGSAIWEPAGGCFSLDHDSRLELIDLNDSVNAAGASSTWTFEGDPTTFAYTSAGITSINQGLVPFLHDNQGGGGPEIGLGTAQLEWTEHDNRAPTLAMSVGATGTRTVFASANGTSDPDGHAVTYTWIWGDGNTSTGKTASWTYQTAAQYTVRLYTNDSLGAANTSTRSIGAAPTATLNSTARGLTVYVSATGSSDPNGLSLSYAWAFGDGGTATGTPALYTYSANATDTVNLTVTNLFGTSGYATQSVLHNGTMWLNCTPTAAVGTVSNCANAQSASDSGLTMSLTEAANASSSSRRHLYVHVDVTGFAESSKAHTVEVRARHSGGAAEALAFQVKDWSTNTWSTPSGFTWSSSTASTATHVLTANQWNNGNPDFRFVDSACTSAAYTCGTAADTDAATWQVDWVRVISS